VNAPGVRFARVVFLIAGLLGILELLPLYFYEAALNRIRPLTYPEFYYGFAGVALAWQIAFLIISRDPGRYRPLMPAIFLEKLLFPAAAYLLYARGRLGWTSMLSGASLDLIWLALFVVAWVRLGRGVAPAPADSAQQ
jgi:hypothetical protein